MCAPGRHAALVGGTATGKSTVALAIAADDPSWEIVTVDSMQVYRGMDIGTAKPTPAEQAIVPHHLLDVADPWDDYDVSTYQATVRGVLADIEARGRRALLVGGTALYLRAVVDDLELPGPVSRDPSRTRRRRRHPRAAPPAGGARPGGRGTHGPRQPAAGGPGPRGHRWAAGDRSRRIGPGLDQHPPTPFGLVALRWDRATLDARIDARYEQQMAQGFLDEVRGLVAAERAPSRSARQALGYRELLAHLAGEMSLAAAVDLARQRTRRFSRRQGKWFHRDPRIRWFDVDHDPRAVVDDVRAALGDGAT